MSQFTTPAVLEMLDNYKWRLVEPFEYYSNVRICTLDSSLKTLRVDCDPENSLFAVRYIDVPVGYITDLASVPRALWSIFPPHGRYAKAAIVHDFLYANAIGDKAFADDVFLEAMTVLDVPRWRRLLMYWAVRLFGRGSYGKDKHV